VISEESGVINVEWSGFGGEWSDFEKKSGVVSEESGVISEESGVINVEWSGFGGEWSEFSGEWSAKRRVEWFRRGVECEKKSGVRNVEWSGFGGDR
jgi:hypothetical protein